MQRSRGLRFDSRSALPATVVALSIAASCAVSAQQPEPASSKPPAGAVGVPATPPTDVKFYGSPNSPISSGVLIPPVSVTQKSV